MLKSLFLGLALVIYSVAQSQNVILEKHFPEGDQITKAFPVPDGYIVLGHRHRYEQINNRGYNWYAPFLVKLDGNMNQVWRKSWPEGRSARMKDLAIHGQYIYLLGIKYPVEDEGGQGWLIRLNSNGRVVSDKTYTYPSHRTVEGEWLEVLPNGQLIAMLRAYRNFGSYGHPWMMRLTPSGDKVWSRLFGKEYPLVGIRNMTLTSDGNALFTGHVYESTSRLRDENASGWIFKMDLKNPRNIYMEKISRDYRNLIFGEAIELQNGNIWVLGLKKHPSGKSRQACIFEYDSQGNLINSKAWSDPKSMIFSSFCWNAADQSIYIVGTRDLYGLGHKGKPCFIQLDGEWQPIRDRTGERGARNLQVIPFNNGEMMLVSWKGIQIVR